MLEASPSVQGTELRVSDTVESASGRFPPDEPIPAVELVKAILAPHTEYGRGTAASLALHELPRMHKRPVQSWLKEVRILFDEDKAPKLHGRLVIIGLSLLEPELRRQLQ